VLCQISARAAWGATAAIVGGCAAVGLPSPDPGVLSGLTAVSGCLVCTVCGVTFAVAGPSAGSGVGLRFSGTADSASGGVSGGTAADPTAPGVEGDAASWGGVWGPVVGTAALAVIADAKTDGLAAAGLDGAPVPVRTGVREEAGREFVDGEAVTDGSETAAGVGAAALRERALASAVGTAALAVISGASSAGAPDPVHMGGRDEVGRGLVDGEAAAARTVSAGGLDCAIGAPASAASWGRAAGSGTGTVTPTAMADAETEGLAAGSAAASAVVHIAAAGDAGGAAGAGEPGCNICAGAWPMGASASAAGTFAGSAVWTEPSEQATAELSHRNACPFFCAKSGEGVPLLGVAVLGVAVLGVAVSG